MATRTLKRSRSVDVEVRGRSAPCLHATMQAPQFTQSWGLVWMLLSRTRKAWVGHTRVQAEQPMHSL